MVVEEEFLEIQFMWDIKKKIFVQGLKADVNYIYKRPSAAAATSFLTNWFFSLFKKKHV